MSIRVLRVYHSAVVAEYRQRDRLLRERFGYDLHVVCPPAWSEGGSVVTATPDDEVPVHVVGIGGRRNHPILFWYRSRALRRVIREVRPQIIDIHEEPYSLALALALRDAEKEAPDAPRAMYTAQNIEKRYPPPFRQLEQRAYRHVGAAYPCSTEAGEILRRKGYRGDVHVLPLGVTVPPPPTRRPSPMSVGFVGRLEDYKGAHLALEAFARAAAGRPAEMHVLGGGPREPDLRQQARDLGVDEQVMFHGPVSQESALGLIAGFHVLLVPSLTTPTWKEQFGRVAAQSMVTGGVVIAFESGSLPEVVGDAGIIVSEGDVDALADAVARLLADPAERERLGAAARARAEEEFTWHRVAEGFDAMYRRLLDSRPAER